MSGFKASERVSGLSYDFRGVEVDDINDQTLLDDARGTTPEPSSRQVRTMQACQREILGLGPDTTPEDMNKALAGKSEAEWFELDDEVLDMIADVTSGRPSRDELAALPFRAREAYYGWILGELNNPSAGASGTTRRALAPVKNA